MTQDRSGSFHVRAILAGKAIALSSRIKCSAAASGGYALMRRKVISNHLAAFHHEADTLQFVNVRNGVARNGDEIGEFAGLDSADAVLPAEHFGSVGCDGRRISSGGIPASCK